MTTRKKPSTGLQQARERAAGELNLPLSDHRVDRLAKLVIADEAMQSLLVVAPERVDFGKMLEVDQALAALRQELKPAAPLALKVSFVSGVVALVPDGNGGVVETHPPLKRLQGPDLRRLAPPDNAAPFGDNRTVSEVMRAIDRQYQ